MFFYHTSAWKSPVAWRVPAADRGGGVAPDMRQTRRDPAQGPPDSATRLLPGQKSEKTLAPGRSRSDGDEAVHGMGHVGRAGFHRRGRKCAGFGAIRNRQVAARGRV